MIKKLLAALILGSFSSGILATTFEENGIKLDVNGYLGYKYVYSSERNSAVGSSPEAGLVLSLQPTEHLTFYSQLAYEHTLESSLIYSFASYDWQFDNGVQVTIKGGKLRIEQGLYNRYRINPRSRPGVIVPQAIYWDSLSTILTSGTGVGFDIAYKNFRSGFSIDEPASINSVNESKVWTTGLLKSLDLNFSTRTTEFIEYDDNTIPLKLKLTGMQLDFGGNISSGINKLFPSYVSRPNTVGKNEVYVASVEYGITEKLSIIGESIFVKRFFDTYNNIPNWNNGFSITGKYELSETMTIYSNYNQYISKPVKGTPLSPWYKSNAADTNIGLNYHRDNWQLGLEAHYLQGGRTVSPNDFSNDPKAYKSWMMIGLNFVYYF